MNSYDPASAPNPKAWLELDEQERMELVEKYHRKACVQLPNARLHAAMHAIVENQLATGEPAGVPNAMRRLMTEGLDRHDAIHAIGSVLAGLMYDVAHKRQESMNPNEEYERALKRLNAREWSAG